MASLIGPSLNQIPTNGMLGELAFQNSTGITVRNIQSPVGVVSVTTSDGFPTSGSSDPGYTNLTLQPLSGNVVIGSGSSLATTANNGFLCIPTCAGAPTVGPATDPNRAVPVGAVPLIYDTTNNRLYIRTPAGVWRYATTT